jgi:hypothetical protein
VRHHQLQPHPQHAAQERRRPPAAHASIVITVTACQQ